MRILIIVLFLGIQHSNCGPFSWLSDLEDAIQNKTIQIENYVQEKGRSIGGFFDNVENKVNSYIDTVNDKINDKINDIEDMIEEKEKYMSEKLEGYINTARTTSSKIFDTIAPEHIDHVCVQEDPALHMTIPQLITLHGYPSETHIVVTDDGYLLTVHRIPFSRTFNRTIPKRTVLVHHGLLGTAIDWIIPGPEKSLPYILSDAGYDVWLANVRGNTYSKAHMSRYADSDAFWDFSFHEVGQHDLPAVINYIMWMKGNDVKINYIGFSMGTSALFALLSTKPEYNNVLRAGFAMAPVAYMSGVKGPFKLLSRFSYDIHTIFKAFGVREFLPHNAVARWLSKHSCKVDKFEEAMCENSMFVLCGFDETQFNRTLFPMIMSNVPAGASTKTLLHYGQIIHNGGRFRMFDYGVETNLRVYGSEEPPAYPLNKITLPIALLSGEDDWLSTLDDAKRLYSELVNPIEHYVVPLKTFNHLDFLWAKDAPSLVYDKLLRLMEMKTSHD